MSNKLHNKPDPKNNDKITGYITITTFFVYEETGFMQKYERYNSLKEALQHTCYNELYIAQKVDEKTVEKLIKEYK